MQYVEKTNLPNDYAYGNPTSDERKHLIDKGYIFWARLIKPDPKLSKDERSYEMWIREIR